MQLARVDGIMVVWKGSMGKLLNDEAFYQNIKSSTKNLELLLQDIRLTSNKICEYLFWKEKTNLTCWSYERFYT
jgi:hypothetical protein